MAAKQNINKTIKHPLGLIISNHQTSPRYVDVIRDIKFQTPSYNRIRIELRPCGGVKGRMHKHSTCKP